MAPPTSSPRLDDPGVSAERFETWRHSRAWIVATVILGVGLWAQLFWVGLAAEGQFEQPRPWAMIAYLMPLGLLAVGAWSRAPVVLLTLLPTSFLPGLTLLPETERALLGEAGSMIRVGATLALYLAVASAGSGPERVGEASIEPLEDQESAPAWSLRRFVLARLGVLGVLFALPAWAVFQDPQVAADLSRHYASDPAVARSFLGLTHFFVWSVAAYMMVLVPALNVEYDRRRLDRRIRELGEGLTRRKLGLRVAAWVGGSAAMILVAWWLT